MFRVRANKRFLRCSRLDSRIFKNRSRTIFFTCSGTNCTFLSSFMTLFHVVYIDCVGILGIQLSSFCTFLNVFTLYIRRISRHKSLFTWFICSVFVHCDLGPTQSFVSAYHSSQTYNSIQGRI